MICLGIENLIQSPRKLKGKKVAVIASAASVDRYLNTAVDLLWKHPDINLVKVFGAQQGFWGETQDNMIEWEGQRFPSYNVPLHSLYGKTRKPRPQELADIDLLVFDLQDVGTRVYTFIWTMILAMEACAENDKEFIVCDRPNPINGVTVEGNVSRSDWASFVALRPLPMRHGMTNGEIASYVNTEFKIGCQLTVIKMTGWKRAQWHDQTGLPWVIPSANMPTLDTATVYPGTVLFEGTNISEGRGTTRPFELIGAPFIDAFQLADKMNTLKMPGVWFRPCKFIPTFHKFKDEICNGVQLHVTNRKKFNSFNAGFALLKMIRDLAPNHFSWKEPPYEYVFDKRPIDVILGSKKITDDLENGKSLSQLLGAMKKETEAFQKIRRKYLLY